MCVFGEPNFKKQQWERPAARKRKRAATPKKAAVPKRLATAQRPTTAERPATSRPPATSNAPAVPRPEENPRYLIDRMMEILESQEIVSLGMADLLTRLSTLERRFDITLTRDERQEFSPQTAQEVISALLEKQQADRSSREQYEIVISQIFDLLGSHTQNLNAGRNTRTSPSGSNIPVPLDSIAESASENDESSMAPVPETFMELSETGLPPGDTSRRDHSSRAGPSSGNGQISSEGGTRLTSGTSHGSRGDSRSRYTV